MPIEGSSGLGFGPDHEAMVERQAEARRLDRVLSFCGLNLSDVLSSSVERRRVAFYLSIDREVERTGEVLDLERQWNPHRFWK
ncbi:MAG: hypothetical protein AAGI46_15910 [Planctomycetota bacterium]